MDLTLIQAKFQDIYSHSHDRDNAAVNDSKDNVTTEDDKNSENLPAHMEDMIPHDDGVSEPINMDDIDMDKVRSEWQDVIEDNVVSESEINSHPELKKYVDSFFSFQGQYNERESSEDGVNFLMNYLVEEDGGFSDGYQENTAYDFSNNPDFLQKSEMFFQYGDRGDDTIKDEIDLTSGDFPDEYNNPDARWVDLHLEDGVTVSFHGACSKNVNDFLTNYKNSPSFREAVLDAAKDNGGQYTVISSSSEGVGGGGAYNKGHAQMKVCSDSSPEIFVHEMSHQVAGHDREGMLWMNKVRNELFLAGVETESVKETTDQGMSLFNQGDDYWNQVSEDSENADKIFNSYHDIEKAMMDGDWDKAEEIFSDPSNDVDINIYSSYDHTEEKFNGQDLLAQELLLKVDSFEYWAPDMPAPPPLLGMPAPDMSAGAEHYRNDLKEFINNLDDEGKAKFKEAAEYIGFDLDGFLRS